MTILNSTDILMPNGSMMFGCLLCGVACFLCFFVYIVSDRMDFTPAGVAIVSLLLVLMLGFGATKFGDPTGRYTLEVTLDDTVTFKEICEEYKFIEQRGDIYVFETKEVEEK